jgi:hypothetical protein
MPPPPSPFPTPPPPPGTTLYQSPQQYSAATPLDGYNVVASYGTGVNAYTRTIPVLVRYPAGTTGKLPLVLWSHGGTKKTDGKYKNKDWADALVQAGYIVVHMSHLPRTDAERNLLATEFGFAPNLADNEVESNIDRPRDVIAVLNDLKKIEAFFPELAGEIDYSRIGLGGHSRGSYTVRTTECARVDLPGNPDYSLLDASKPTNTALTVQPKAYLANSPQGIDRFGLKSDSWRDCTKPDLTQTGPGDTTPGEDAPSRLDGYKAMPPGDKYLMYIDDPNTPHELFDLNVPDLSVFESYVRTTGVAFMDAYLKGLPAAKAYLTSKTLEAISGDKATISVR